MCPDPTGALPAPAALTAQDDRPPRLRPLQDLPVGRLAQLRGVLTDIDDTLTCEGEIAPAALAALHSLAAAGLPVLPITGRPAGWSLPMVRDWPVPAIVAENGGVLLQRDGQAADGVRLAYTVDEPTRAARWARLQACAADVLQQVPGATLARDSAGRLTDIAVDHSEFAHLGPAQIEAVCTCMRAHGLTATVSSIHINGWMGAHNKWSAAAWAVGQVLGLPFGPAEQADWLYVGDSTNDQLMFEHLPLSVGVANIARFVPQLAVLPAYVTQAERGDGFAELAERVLTARARCA